MFIIFYTGLVAAYIVYWKQIDKSTTFILLLLGFIVVRIYYVGSSNICIISVNTLVL